MKHRRPIVTTNKLPSYFYFEMDIRKFLKSTRADADDGKSTRAGADDGASSSKKQKTLPVTTELSAGELASISNDSTPFSSELDVGLYIKSKSGISDDIKYRLLTEPFKPEETYNFKKDVKEGAKRSFRYVWLAQYSPWLAYSPTLKGAVCIYCILFPQTVHRGIQGAFVTSAFTKYKDFNECARNHMSCRWHVNSTADAQNFMRIKRNPNQEIICQLDSSINRTVESNRKKLLSILSSIIFCGTNDITLRGKYDTKGNLKQLFDFRIESGDTLLKNHFETAAKNARYTSHQTQNELISISEEVLRNDLVTEANNAIGFSILADESSDISGTEQLSIGVRFVDLSSQKIIREEFLGFMPLTDMSASGISTAIINRCRQFGLNLNKLLGQGYDGCSAMAGKRMAFKPRLEAFIRRLLLYIVPHIGLIWLLMISMPFHQFAIALVLLNQ